MANNHGKTDYVQFSLIARMPSPPSSPPESRRALERVDTPPLSPLRSQEQQHGGNDVASPPHRNGGSNGISQHESSDMDGDSPETERIMRSPPRSEPPTPSSSFGPARSVAGSIPRTPSTTGARSMPRTPRTPFTPVDIQVIFGASCW